MLSLPLALLVVQWGPLHNSKPSVEIRGQRFALGDGVIAGTGVTARLTTRQSPDSLIVRVTLRNTGKVPARLGKVRLVDGALRMTPGAVALSMTGWQTPSLVKRITERTGSKIFTQVVTPSQTLNLGFITFTRANTEHWLWLEGGQLRVESWCDFEGWALAPGAEVDSEELRLALPDDPLRGLEEWAEAAARQTTPRVWKEPVAGWVGWSWVDPFHVEKYETVVRRNARAIRERLAGFDINYLWVSLGNLQGRQPGNWLAWNRELFASTPQTLIADLAKMGYRFGLWAGAFWLSSQLTAQVADLNDALLRKDGELLFVPHRELGKVYILDPTHPKTHAWLRQTFTAYREWGVRYYMIDFLDSISGSITGRYMPSSYYDKSLAPGPETFRRAIQVIRDAAGDDTYLLASTGPSLHSVGIMDGVRAGSDYGEGRPLDGPGKGFYPGTYVINNANYWTSHRRAVEAWASHFFLHNKLFTADTANVLSVDQPIAVADAQISATIFGLNGAPVMLGDDIANLSASRLELLKKVFPRGSTSAQPVDLFDSPSPDYPKVFRLTVRKPWDEWDVVAVFNFGKDVLHKRLNFRGERVVWDVWGERFWGAHDGGFDVAVMPESVRLLRLTPVRSHPWVAGTDMHVRQGEAELDTVQWDTGAGELRITARRPAGSRGNVFVRAPAGWAVKDPKDLWLARDGADNSLTIRIAFEFPPSGQVSRTISFVPMSK